MSNKNPKTPMLTHFTLIDMVQCSECASYFEALPGESTCTACSQAAEVKSIMRPYQRAAMETWRDRYENDDFYSGNLVDIFV